MAGNYGGYDDDEEDVLAPKEPQVTSDDPAERKAARWLRIKRRQDALKKAEQPLEETAEEEPGPIEQATALAAEELQRLALDGAAKVTNVKVTTDEREVIRRGLFSEMMLNSLEKIELEANEAQTQYEAISINWEKMLEIRDPLDIDEAMKEQKRQCDELIEQKNIIIDELKNDLKKMDDNYYIDLDKQDNDIKELSERIEKQITIMQRAYEKQLSLIDHAINIEREAMVDHNNKRWEALYKQRDREEVSHMAYKYEQLEEHKQEIERIMWDHHEKYREAKIELESLIQELQKELEKLKATCIINTEKIGYNYQVLKKREEENVFVRSQQKRKLNKMMDVANGLRSKIRKAAEDGAIEEMKADAEIIKLMQAMDDLEKKSAHFSHVNNYKFSQVWRMSASRCLELMKELRLAEVALHAHILSEPPPPPPPQPPSNPLLKYEIESNPEVPEIVQVVEDPHNMVVQDAKDKLIHHILQLVADNTGFLVEDRLLKLIEKYALNSRNLCTLDSIFMALEVQAEEDIALLCKTFLNYAVCPVCTGVESVSEVEMAFHQDETSSKGRDSIRPRFSIARSMSASTSRSLPHMAFKPHEITSTDRLMMAEADEIMQKFLDQKATDSLPVPIEAGGVRTPKTRQPGIRGVTVTSQQSVVAERSPFLCDFGHHLEIEPMHVLTALGEFVSVFVPPEKKRLYDILDDLKPPDFSSPSRKLKLDEIQIYWETWKNLFPPEKDRFWDGLLAGLNSFLPILQERERLHEEVTQLRRRNAALRRLVRGALPELPMAKPKYARAYPHGFTASFPDEAPAIVPKLPPI